MAYQRPYPITKPSKSEAGTVFQLGLITDLDKEAKTTDAAGNTVWKSLLMKGTLTFNEKTNDVSVDVQGTNEATELFSEYARGGRGMELSELVYYEGKLCSVDDRTGIVFRIEDSKPIPWVILADGSGKEAGGFKGEWMTVKEGKLYVGGHGKESMTRDGKKIANKNYQWVKIIDKNGAVTHENWESHYDRMREAAGCPYPGYLTHESGVWSEKHKEWFFLPRKASKEPFHYKLDEKRATNILIRCSEDFSDIKITKIGEATHKTRGFSTFKFVPGTDDHVIVAIKSEEVDDAQKSFLTAFTADGKVLLPDKEFSTNMKYEGIEFL